MSDPTSQSLNPALIPLDWNFYATDSSVIFKLEPGPLQPYWVEAHAHFGRFNTLPLSLTLTSHQRGLEEGTALLERILKELLQRRLPAFFSRSGPPTGLELQPSIYYFGIHVQMDAIALDDALIKHIPRRARAQVEKVLSVIPSEDLGSAMPVDVIANQSPDMTPPPEPPVAQQPSAPIPEVIIPETAPAPTTETVEPTTKPVAKSATKTAKPAKKKTKAKRSAPSPGFTADTAPASPAKAKQVIQPDLVSISAPAASPAAQAPATATAVMTTPVTTEDVWDWEEDDDDIVF